MKNPITAITPMCFYCGAAANVTQIGLNGKMECGPCFAHRMNESTFAKAEAAGRCENCGITGQPLVRHTMIGFPYAFCVPCEDAYKANA